MARTLAGTQLTVQHRSAQLGLRALTLREFLRLWPLWTGDAASFARLVAAAVPLTQMRHQTSAALASSYYQAFRFAEGASGAATPRLASTVESDRVVASLYVTGQVQTGASLRAGMNPREAMNAALVRTSGALTRHVLAGGRDTLLESVEADRQATGWQRVTGGKPCSFCAMLASRGPIYKAEESAGFQAHDTCACHSEPVYSGGEWTDQARGYRAQWNEATQGLSGNDALNAFRREFEAV